MWKRWSVLWLFFVGVVVATQYACSPLAAGVGGAAAGAAIEHKHDKNSDKDKDGD